jgi:hypothetical protein
MFAKSGLWTVRVKQDDSAMGNHNPTSISKVIYAAPGVPKMSFGKSAKWPTSSKLFNVTILNHQTMQGRNYDTEATVTADDLISHLTRYL